MKETQSMTLALNTVILALLSIWSPITAAQSAPQVDQMVICRIKKHVRTIRVILREDSDCETIYTKFGRDRVIGTGRMKSSCINFLKNVQGNLQEAGWKCREVEKASINIISGDEESAE
jgi:hypothetical protein